jgi:hypothetical protein
MGDEVTYSFLREHINPPFRAGTEWCRSEKNYEKTKKEKGLRILVLGDYVPSTKSSIT